MFYLHMILMFLTTVISGYFITKKLRDLKLEQTIRDDGPQTHLKKQGTPSMGGLIFLLPIIIFSLFYLPQTFIPLAAVLGYGFIGIYDDLDKRVVKKSGGLSIRKKLILEIIFGVLVAIIALLFNNEMSIGFTENITLPLALPLFIFFIAFFLIAVTNGTNLTDGLDGLLTLTTIPIFILFTFISLKQDNIILAQFNCLIIISLFGFLFYNKYPAKIFMGDTGSLALGALVASMSIILKIELLLPVFGLVYLLESLSVMLQVGYFKKTGGKRLLKMAPLHHHFELTGWKETKVVLIFTLVSIIVSFIAYGLYILF